MELGISRPCYAFFGPFFGILRVFGIDLGHFGPISLVWP